MDHTYKNSKTVVTHQYFRGRTFTTINTAINTTAVHRRKKKCFKLSSWAENTARGVRFLLRFSTYVRTYVSVPIFGSM